MRYICSLPEHHGEIFDFPFMPTITLTSCPVCGSSKLEKVFDAVDHFATKEIFPVCECRECSFRFTNSFPSEEMIGRYYDSADYISHSDSDKGVVNRLYHYFRKRMLQKKVDLVAAHAQGDSLRMLDIGCGTGYFLQAAKERGWHVRGIEKNSAARESAIARTGAVIEDENGLWNLEEGTFEVVTLWHVLEHIEKLNETLEKLQDILKPDGVAVIALPNHRAYDAQCYRSFWAAYDVPRHLWHFSPGTVEKLLKKHGLKIIETDRMPLDAFYISMLSEQYKKSNFLLKYGRAFLVGLIGYLRSLRHVAQSSSLIYIVKKD